MAKGEVDPLAEALPRSADESPETTSEGGTGDGGGDPTAKGGSQPDVRPAEERMPFRLISAKERTPPSTSERGLAVIRGRGEAEKGRKEKGGRSIGEEGEKANWKGGVIENGRGDNPEQKHRKEKKEKNPSLSAS